MSRILLFFSFLLFFLSKVPAQESYDKPRLGEGISTFLERNGRVGRKYYSEFIQMNQQRLCGKNELRLGVRYALPPLHGNVSSADTDKSSTLCVSQRSEPLFGKSLSNVKVVSSRLRGACFYVVPGHGGPDPGAIGRVGMIQLHEDEYAYDVALRLARQLMSEGAEVRIIIQDAKDGIRDTKYLSNSKGETCMGQRIPLNQVERLQQRCDKVNELNRKDRRHFKYCRTIFLHVDSRSKRMQTDVFFYHAPGSVLGKRLAFQMKNTFESKYGKHQPNRGFNGTVSQRDLFVLQKTIPVGLFVELGNIQNSFDQRRFVISSNREALARWLRDGFVADFRK